MIFLFHRCDMLVLRRVSCLLDQWHSILPSMFCRERRNKVVDSWFMSFLPWKFGEWFPNRGCAYSSKGLWKPPCVNERTMPGSTQLSGKVFLVYFWRNKRKNNPVKIGETSLSWIFGERKYCCQPSTVLNSSWKVIVLSIPMYLMTAKCLRLGQFFIHD